MKRTILLCAAVAAVACVSPVWAAPSLQFVNNNDSTVTLQIVTTDVGSLGAETAVTLEMSPTINLVGINYKDKPEDAKAWLEELGNPYLRIGSDESGRSGLEWGISGVPESFLIDGTGTVIWRYVGPIVTEQAQDDLRRALAATRERAAS